MDTFCQAFRCRGLMIKRIPTKMGIPASTIRESCTFTANMKMPMNRMFKISRKKLMMPFDRISDTLLT